MLVPHPLRAALTFTRPSLLISSFSSDIEILLRVQIVPDRTLQLGRALAQHACQVLKIVAGRDAEFADKIFGGSLEVAVVFFLHVVFWTAEVGVG